MLYLVLILKIKNKINLYDLETLSYYKQNKITTDASAIYKTRLPIIEYNIKKTGRIFMTKTMRVCNSSVLVTKYLTI